MTVWFDAIALAAGVAATPDHRPAAKTRRGGPAGRLARDILTDIGGAVPLRALARLRRWHKRRKAIAELGALDDRMLKDIGVSRGAIRELVDAQLRFEAEAVAAAEAAEPRPARASPDLGARPGTQPC